ncbi:MAG: patatin-like phospholipase family protein [Methylobacterium sp.]|uniref:patatin-like phospholipase family protein n=1 Tax=Methylobacterium sp. TaxID=409 RepID=UPI0025EF189F|nr:patatin-like phospholipase family protein [Methylobacterium sp.]MBX9931316.1 patatin-like phospholipase family protein [Methylobacterium sp.]
MTMFARSKWLRATIVIALAAHLGACGSTPRVSYTASEAAAASVPGMDLSVRAFADASEKTFTEMVARPEAQRKPFAYLALSGGGGDGAFGAGILNGWTASGKRPEFSLVSGVSTGALIAPFAFLGSGYDSYLTDFYTSGVASTLVQSPSVANVLFGSGLFGDGRLRELVGRYVTPDLLTAIAAEHAKGRRLLVVTTNLDSQRAVIWNMGAIAASNSPNAVSLFSDVLTASASIPAVFPPQFLEVQAEGRAFQEMHVDGSVVTPVFTLPQSFLLRDGRLRVSSKSDIYVIINGRLEPEFDPAQNNTLSIVERSFTTASRARSRATLASTYAFTRSNGIGFNLTYIDESAPNANAARGFDTGYMRSLYQDGYEKGRSGAFWFKNVPTAPLVKAIVAAR